MKTGRTISGASVILHIGLVLACLAGATPALGSLPDAAPVEPGAANTGHEIWSVLIAQAEQIGLPVGFLRVIRPDFVTVEFDDLHAFAAEYHPDEHRMVLNRTLSFNGAGGTLKPLATLPHRDVGTVFHELLHAYLDFLFSLPDPAAAGPAGARLVAFARNQQQCRYQDVAITPVLQRKTHTETRTLTERESWEALHETWAVFVGWTIWTRLEIKGANGKEGKGAEAWLMRLKRADREGELTGYYEPEDPAERAIARKRYLAPSHRISSQEVAGLLELVLEASPKEARRSAGILRGRKSSESTRQACSPAIFVPTP